MSLLLKGVSKVVNGQTHIHPTDLELQTGTMNVLLGSTSSGKTSLMRLMAGLDVPNTGKIIWDGRDVTGLRVQDRGVAMVYQQFINYPSMTVTEITGSETFIHLDHHGENWVGLLHGVKNLEIGAALNVYLDPRHIYIFAQDGASVAPASYASAA